MRSNTTKEYHFTGDYYGYINVTSADGTVTERQYDAVPTQVNMTVSVNITGDLLIDSQTKMKINGYIFNILDRAGEEIYEDGQWIIVQTQPLLDPLGYKDGYRYRAKILAGDS